MSSESRGCLGRRGGVRCTSPHLRDGRGAGRGKWERESAIDRPDPRAHPPHDPRQLRIAESCAIVPTRHVRRHQLSWRFDREGGSLFVPKLTSSRREADPCHPTREAKTAHLCGQSAFLTDVLHTADSSGQIVFPDPCDTLRDSRVARTLHRERSLFRVSIRLSRDVHAVPSSPSERFY